MPLTWQDVAGQVAAPDFSDAAGMITQGVKSLGTAVSDVVNGPEQRRKADLLRAEALQHRRLEHLAHLLGAAKEAASAAVSLSRASVATAAMILCGVSLHQVSPVEEGDCTASIINVTANDTLAIRTEFRGGDQAQVRAAPKVQF